MEHFALLDAFCIPNKHLGYYYKNKVVKIVFKFLI